MEVHFWQNIWAYECAVSRLALEETLAGLEKHYGLSIGGTIALLALGVGVSLALGRLDTLAAYSPDPFTIGPIVIAALAIYGYSRTKVPLVLMKREIDERDDKIEKLSGYKKQLDDLMTPKVELIFEGYPRCHAITIDGDVYRLRVNNLSAVLLKNVRVALEDIQPWEHGYPLIAFRQWGDDEENLQQFFDLTPFGRAYVDILLKPHTDWFVLCYAMRNVANPLPLGCFTLRLRVEGESIVPRFYDVEFGIMEDKKTTMFTLRGAVD